MKSTSTPRPTQRENALKAAAAATEVATAAVLPRDEDPAAEDTPTEADLRDATKFRPWHAELIELWKWEGFQTPDILEFGMLPALRLKVTSRSKC